MGHFLCMRVHLLSRVWPFATLWTRAHQVPLSMVFSRQEYWSGSPFPSLGDLSGPGIEPVSPALAGGFFTTEPPGKPLLYPHVMGKGTVWGPGACEDCISSLWCFPYTCFPVFTYPEMSVLLLFFSFLFKSYNLKVFCETQSWSMFWNKTKEFHNQRFLNNDISL